MPTLQFRVPWKKNKKDFKVDLTKNKALSKFRGSIQLDDGTITDANCEIDESKKTIKCTTEDGIIKNLVPTPQIPSEKTKLISSEQNLKKDISIEQKKELDENKEIEENEDMDIEEKEN